MTDAGVRVRVLAVLAASAMVLIGCGGGSNKNASSGASAPVSAGSTSGSSAVGSPAAGSSVAGSSVAGSSVAGSSVAGSPAPSRTSTAASRPAGSAQAGSTASTAGGQEGATGPSLNDCTLATSANVVAAFGGKVITSGASTTGTGAQLCKFQVANGRAAKNLTISFSVHTPVKAADFRSGEASAVRGGATTVGGVGSGAYFVRSSATLQFLSGSTGGFVQVQAPLAAGSATGPIQAGTVALARAIIAGL